MSVSGLNSDSGRIAVLNEGKGCKLIASNMCGDFKFDLYKAPDPRTNVDAIADYDKNVFAYVGARNWTKHKFLKDYTNPSQLKFSNIKVPGADYLVDMKWWLDYEVEISFNDFPYPVESEASGLVSSGFDGKSFLGKDNIFCLRPYPLHQCTDNIHLRLNNRDMISYPIQMLNQRMEYWSQDRFKDSCGFCPHRKMNCQTSYEFDNNMGRSPFMNLGATYDGDFGNEIVLGDIIWNMDGEYNRQETERYRYTIPAQGEEDEDEEVETHIPWKLCKGSIRFKMREPVMVEPLDYYSSRNGSKTMNNVVSIDLEYNFNNLRNMILFNRGKLYHHASKMPLRADYAGLPAGTFDWWNALIEDNLESMVSVSIKDAWLEFDIATPNIPPSLPFVTDYVEYRRYETTSSETVLADQIKTNRNLKYRIDSDIYGLTYMPNSIYVWVAPNDSVMYGSNFRCLLNNSYAQITKVEVDFGNLVKLGQTYEERDLFLMALRNGLEDRVYADWTRTNKCFYHPKPAFDPDDQMDYMDNIHPKEFYGVGSVLRMIPGIDLCSGGETTLIGGMKISNETIRFHVEYRPLNMLDNIQYSLFVAFEYNGICTITPGFCDLAMIHIESYNQIADAQIAPRYRISRIYGKGLWNKTKNFFRKANTFARKTQILSKTLGAIPTGPTQTAAKILGQLGYGYGSTKMKGGMVIPPGSFYRKY